MVNGYHTRLGWSGSLSKTRTVPGAVRSNDSQTRAMPPHVSRAPPPHGLIRKTRRDNRHDDVQRGANVDWRGGGGVCDGRDDGGQDAHDAVEADGDAVAGAAVGGGEDFGGVGVEGAVVDVLGGLVMVGTGVGEGRGKGAGRTRQKLMADVKPTFSAAVRTWV